MMSSAPRVFATDPPGHQAGPPEFSRERLESQARAVISPVFELRRHELAAVLVDSDGTFFTGINLKAGTGRANVCSEGVALANAMASGRRQLSRLLILHKQGPEEMHGYRLVPPCGVCRELLVDYAPDLLVHLTTANGLELVSVTDLLPIRYEELPR